MEPQQVTEAKALCVARAALELLTLVPSLPSAVITVLFWRGWLETSEKIILKCVDDKRRVFWMDIQTGQH